MEHLPHAVTWQSPLGDKSRLYMWRRLLSVRCSLHSLQKFETMQWMWEGTARKTREWRLFYLKSWMLSWQLAPRSDSATAHQWNTRHLTQTWHFTLSHCVSILFLHACLISKVLLRKELCPPAPWRLNLCFSALKHHIPWRNSWANLTLSIQKSTVTLDPISVPHPHLTNSKLLLHLMGPWCPVTPTSATSMKDMRDRKITVLCSRQAWNSVR